MPLLVGNKIYVHMPKTGGSWVARFLGGQHGTQFLGTGGHMPAKLLKGHQMKDRILWGTIRDPWSWYLSWYHHGMKAVQNRKVMAEYGNGSTEFKDVLMGALARDPNRCPKNVGAIWSTPNDKASRDEYLKGPGGLYSWTFFHVYGDTVKRLVDTANLYAGIEVLYGDTVDPEVHPPANPRRDKKDRKPKDMYDTEMIDAVYAEDESLISHLGYEEPFSTLKETILKL